MTDSKALREKIKNSGMKYQHIAKRLNITPFGLKKKIDNINEFKASEIIKISQVLNITDSDERDRIFFANVVDR